MILGGQRKGSLVVDHPREVYLINGKSEQAKKEK